MTQAEARVADQMIVCMHRRIVDGDFLGEGIGAFLPTAAYMLAKRTHAPRATSLCPNGNTLQFRTRPLTLNRDEFDTIRGGVQLDYVKINTVYMPAIFMRGRPRWVEFMRPAQLDAWGATNNSTIGSWERPRLQLPGPAGIPDASPIAPRLFFYVPRHSKAVFVERLDFKSGTGNAEGGPAIPICVVTDLCVMVSADTGRLRLESVHPGVDLATVQERTGFALDASRPVPVTEPPTHAERELLRFEIDPHGLRRLEMLSGRERRAAIGAMLRTTAAT